VHFCKDFFHFPRPFAILPEVNILDNVRAAEDPHVSFPSGHSAFVMLMAAGMWPVLNGFGRVFNGLGVLWVGFSRIALGVHFPADVVWSMLISLIVVLVIRAVVRKILGRRFPLSRE
jgi:membrane-associated phospholipid phosphatase